MKPAFVVTVHQSQKYRPNGHKLLERYLQTLEENLKIPYDIFIIENASEDLFKFDKKYHYRYFPDQLKGMTRCWNEGVKYAIENENDFICVTNEDIFYNDTINNFFNDIREFPDKDISVFGPVSDCESTFFPQRAKTTTEGFIRLTNPSLPIHGWFLGFSKNYYNEFKRRDENLFDPNKIWRGQESFQSENWKKGAKSYVVKSCMIHHDHLGSWRKTISDIQQK